MKEDKRNLSPLHLLLRTDRMLLVGHALALLPFMKLLLFAILGDHFNYNDEIAQYTGPGQVIHGGAWMFPWDTPICFVAGIVVLVTGCKRRKVITIAEGLWLWLYAVFAFFLAYPLYVHFS